jgi:hypothetical protein
MQSEKKECGGEGIRKQKKGKRKDGGKKNFQKRK